MRVLAVLAVVGLVAIVAIADYRRFAWVPGEDSSLAEQARLGGRIAALHCAACHGPAGNAADPAIPKLAGQGADYLVGQLIAFREGRRTSRVMAPIVANLSVREMREVAAYFAVQPIRPDAPGDAALQAAGKQLFWSGMAALSSPPCSACHVADGARAGARGPMARMGTMRGMGMMRIQGPNLFGQHAAYTIRQLRAFADGKRPGVVMAPIAASMTLRERRAVADYLASAP